MASESDRTQFRIRIYLPTGYTCTLQLYGKTTFEEVRNQCWQKKSKDFGCPKNEARFRLYTTELFFNDDQTISYMVSVYPSFEGLGTVDRYSILMESPSERGDRAMREKMKVDGKKPIFWQGYLLKCSKPTGKGFWKKQYVVFQNQTLMLYASSDEFSKGKKAHKYIAMGAIIPQLDHHACKTANKKFPLVLDVPVGKGSKPGIYVLSGDSEAVRRSFVEVVSKYLFFKKCSMVLNILPSLYLNEFASTQGIFRIAGEANKIKQYQEQIDDGIIPNFIKLINDSNIHNFTGLLKRQLRFMLSPIIPETHYEAFIDIGRQLTEDKRVEQLNFVIKSLASTSVVVLAELFRFLYFAVNYESKSKMGAVNFAIVIGPNILRSELENANPMKAIDDNKHMQTTISTMISHYEQILPSQDDLYKFDRATNPKWKYGVIDAPPQSKSPQLKNIQSAGGNSSAGFGLFALTQKVQGGDDNNNNNVINSNAMRQFSQSVGDMNNNNNNAKKSASPPPPTFSKYGANKMIGDANVINSVQLKKTQHKQAQKPNIAPSSSQSGTVNFGIVLKPTNSNKAKDDSSHSYHSSGGTHDWRSQMKKKKKPEPSNTVPPKELAGQLSALQQPPPMMGDQDGAGAPSPKLPPPNPIEVMSSEQRQKQKENTQILEVFQDFEENMALHDEEIDFKQSFAESIVSQIMELAENNKVVSASKYAKQIDEKCKQVIDAAKQHSDALQQFNHMLQTMYSQMLDGLEQGSNDNQGGIAGVNGSSSNLNNGYGVTAGGPDDGSGGGGGGGGLPHASNYSMDFDQEDSKNNSNIDSEAGHVLQSSGSSNHASQYSYDSKTIAAAISGGLPRYQSATDVAKQAEPEKKIAKALFDYPGGYRSNELTFHRGTSLIITKEKEGWVYGYYELEPSLTGWFPKSYVKIISGQS